MLHCHIIIAVHHGWPFGPAVSFKADGLFRDKAAGFYDPQSLSLRSAVFWTGF